MASQERLIFINLPVEDLDASVAFFSSLGFAFDPKFTDQSATCMILSDKAYVMLLQTDRFGDFVKRKAIGDPQTTTSAIYAVSAADRAGVDAFADAALEAGGSPCNEPMDLGFMYGRSFYDLDGHAWEVMWMAQETVEQGPHDMAEAS